jgi:hypothetical protein
MVYDFLEEEKKQLYDLQKLTTGLCSETYSAVDFFFQVTV